MKKLLSLVSLCALVSCVEPLPPDAGAPDGSGSGKDAGAQDGGLLDGGPRDAHDLEPDGGAGPGDASVPDDGGLSDAGSIADDAGDLADAGAPGDAGTPFGRWGVPESTFTLPANSGQGIYYPNLQNAFPDVDWQTLDRLYLPAGSYPLLNLGNLPTRDPSRPLVITNQGGQVRIGNNQGGYVATINGGSGWVVTGRYDPISETGDPGFPGHAEGYASTQDRYGILFDDDFAKDGHSCLAIGGGASGIELDFLELRRCEFAGLIVKDSYTQSEVDNGQPPPPDMNDISVHDLYIHDMGSEGIYVGATDAPAGQHKLRGFKFFNNRVLRAGTEALQVGQLSEDSEIHHNVLWGAIRWKSAFQPYQDNNAQIGVREAPVRVHHNVLIGAAASLAICFPQPRDGDVHEPGDEVRIEDNYFGDSRNVGVYVHSASDGVTTWRFARNVFRRFDFQRDLLDETATERATIFDLSSNTPANITPLVLDDNRWEGDRTLSNRVNGPNGTNGNITQTNNANEVVTPVSFVDWGLPAGADPLDVEFWDARMTRKRVRNPANNQMVNCLEETDNDWQRCPPIVYPGGALVMHHGVLYRALQENSGQRPDASPAHWESLGLPVDDVRTVAGSPYEVLGVR